MLVCQEKKVKILKKIYEKSVSSFHNKSPENVPGLSLFL